MDPKDLSETTAPTETTDRGEFGRELTPLPLLEPVSELEAESSRAEPAEWWPAAEDDGLKPAEEPVVLPPEEPVVPPLDEPKSVPPSASQEKDDRFATRVVIGAVIVGLLFFVGATFLWKAHSDLGALRQEVSMIKAQAQRARVLQERAALLRVRTELQTLRQTVPPELSLDVDKADAILTAIDDRLKASQ